MESPYGPVAADLYTLQIVDDEPEPEPDEEYTGPVCRKCGAKPEEGFGYSICGGKWLCDSCAAAAEHEWDRQREYRL